VTSVILPSNRKPSPDKAPGLLGGKCPHRGLRVSYGLLCAATLWLVGCMVGPKYTRPAAEVPATYKETGDWKTAQPSDDAARGEWWKIYQDPQLDALESRIDVSNQNLKAAEAQFRIARDQIRIARASLYPNVTGGGTATGNRLSKNKPYYTDGGMNYADYQIPVAGASYELDLWGRIRHIVEQARSEAQATAADLANVNLSLHAELATDYFEMRGLDAQKRLLDSTVTAYEQALKLTQQRHDGGIASELDVAQAQTQLETTRAQGQDVEVQRSAYEHAIAVLVGQPASTFSVAPLPLDAPPPAIPPGLPSDLLERRPDIAAAERRMQEANAGIGIARAAYFPTITLTGSAGLESGSLGTLFQGPSFLWSLGPTAVETLFDAGRRHAVSDQAKAEYDQSIAKYRETVLESFQEVEDNLAALRILEAESKTQDGAVAAANHTLALSNNRYKGGVSNYLEVITAQSAALSDQRTAVDILTRRLSASVLLIKAIGGGWNTSRIPAV